MSNDYEENLSFPFSVSGSLDLKNLGEGCGSIPEKGERREAPRSDARLMERRLPVPSSTAQLPPRDRTGENLPLNAQHAAGGPFERKRRLTPVIPEEHGTTSTRNILGNETERGTSEEQLVQCLYTLFANKPALAHSNQIWAQFWKIHQLFLKHNTAVPSSASVERLFSVAGDVFSRKRGNITDENFYRQLLLKGSDY
ncbi:hypothetical protein HPB47_002524 [Ixodes persulcatus]|uniref:Uncharacterized protein n=1 Tax=Ixodes persulcatus TaxID=34615 RepID=A0AC60PL19_IXOPE|nr:hypothetical protein HPB47_002524 [Ixodes persulcatus]